MKFFFVGPLIPPVTGQSLAFSRFVETISSDKKIVVNTNFENKTKLIKIFFSIKTLLILFLKALFTDYHLVYFTCSRSVLGSLKDILLINLVSFKKKKIINHLHGSDFYDFLHNSPKWYRKILFKSYEKVDISIVLVESMKSQFRDFKNMRIEVIPNFYDQELDQEIAKKDETKITLLYLSNIMVSKGIFELIDAFEQLIKKNDNIILNIAGECLSDDYMNFKELKKKFDDKILQNNKIRYLGKIFGNDKTKLLQGSDIFILPSYKEAFPISIIEAMASRNAIVVTNHKYISEVLSNKNGVLVEKRSVESLVDGIQFLINNKHELKYIQNYNRQEAKKKFSKQKYLKSLEQIVMDV